ncbi:MAG TPA: hypothetical protein VGC42_21200 [Kofleriaceae bacterium]
MVPVEVSLEHFDVRGLSDDLPWAEQEPGGLEVVASANPAWLQLGLHTGDVIERIDASPVVRSPSLSEGLTIYDVRRGTKHIQLRIHAHGAQLRTVHLTDAALDEINLLRKDPTDHLATPVKRGDRPSGVRIIEAMLALRLDLAAGDLIRTIGGRPIYSDDALAAALAGLSSGHTDMVVERDGRLITITLERDPPEQP